MLGEFPTWWSWVAVVWSESWRPQDIGDARDTCKEELQWECKEMEAELEGKVCCSQQSRRGAPSNLSHIRPESAGFGVCPTGFQSGFWGPAFPHYTPCLPFAMSVYILSHCCWKYVIWFMNLWGYNKDITLSLRRDLVLLNCVEIVKDYGVFWSLTKCIIQNDDMVMSLQGSGMWWFEWEWPPDAYMSEYLVSHLVELFGNDWKVWPCWRRYVTGAEFWGFPRLSLSICFSLCLQLKIKI